MKNTCDNYLKLFGVENALLVFSEEEINWISETLIRQEEIDSSSKDQWGNFDAQFATNDFSLPYLDIFVVNRLHELNLQHTSIWPNQADFSVCLTHDVDRIESYSPTSYLRNLTKRLQFTKSIFSKLPLLPNILKTFSKKILLSKKNDSLWAFEKWVNIENKYGAKSTYFFFVRPPKVNLSIYDCDYLLNDKMRFNNEYLTVKEYILKLKANGDEIGLHGSYYSFNNSTLFGSQKLKLETIIGEPINSTRQHYLHFDVKQTPATHINEGIGIDSTLGFNTAVGFRAGTSFPFYINDSNGYLLEIPLIIMDSALYFDQEKSLESGVSEVLNIINHVENVKGCLTINFHPDYLNDSKYFGTYDFILSTLSKRNCIFMKMKEVQHVIELKCAE